MKKIILLTITVLFHVVALSQKSSVSKQIEGKVISNNTYKLEDTSKASKKQTVNLSSRGGGTVNGGTEGMVSVTPSGALTYNIPIDIPVGIQGVEPNISLNYNSQAGNGLAGWGWDIAGLSVITRIPSTKFHDNEIDPVDFDLMDRFSLDGQRLILKTGSYGGNGAVYQTENYSNIKIISYGTNTISGVTGPKYFKVIYPSGSIAMYGYNDDSRSHMDYAISYFENPQGIKINYVYESSNNKIRINSISYGSRNSSGGINQINFNYATRLQPTQAYINGVKFIGDRRLTAINVLSNQIGYRNYTLSYGTTNLSYDKLTYLTERSGDNTQQRNSISFGYGLQESEITEVVKEYNQLSVENLEQRNANVVTTDISGDGKMDFIVYPTFGPDNKKKFWYFESDNNLAGTNPATEVNTGSFIDILPVNALNHQGKMLASQGVAVVQKNGNTQVRFKVFSQGAPSSGSNIGEWYSKTWDIPTYTTQSDCDLPAYENPTDQKYISGDFDGDGLSDVIAITYPYSYQNCVEEDLAPGETCGGNGGGNPAARGENKTQTTQNSSGNYCCECSTINKSNSAVNLIKLDRRLSSNYASSIGNLSTGISYSDRIVVLDANGDGKSDILQFKDGFVNVYSLNQNNSSIRLLWRTIDSKIDRDFPIMPGDYNGDGKADFMVPHGNNNKNFSLFFSSGTGFVKFDKLQPFEYKNTDYNGSGTLYGYSLIPVDINADGKTDIISYNTTTYNGNSNGIQKIVLYKNKGVTIVDSNPVFVAGGSREITGNTKHFPIPIFLTSNKQNANLEFASISNKWVTSFGFTEDHRKHISLERIVNNGIETTIEYNQINKYADSNNNNDPHPFYIESYSQNYPFVNVNIAPSFRVVNRVTEKTQSSTDRITRYKDFKYEGAVSNTEGLGFIGFEVLKQTNWYGDGVGTLWSMSKHEPSYRGAVMQQWVATSPQSIPGTYISKTDYVYDTKLIANPGSPSAPDYQATINLNSAISGPRNYEAEESITLSRGFHATGSNGAFSALIIPPDQQPGESGYAGVFDVLLKSMSREDVLTGVVTSESYVYDSYNNPTTTTTTFPGGSRKTTYTYKNNESATNKEYHIGRATRMTESATLNGNSFSTETQYTYANNLVTETKRKGNGTSWITETFVHDIFGNITSKTINADGVDPRTESFTYDTGGRFIIKATDVEGLETHFVYNAATGDLQSTTDPYNLTHSFTYDKWNRLLTETDYLGNVTTHEYNQQQQGWLELRTDHPDGGKEYSLIHPMGWPAKSGVLSLNNEWVETETKYDVAGRTIAQSQPYTGSASQWTTTGYDQYGRMVSQQLHTGRSISMTYSGLTVTVNDGVKTTVTTADALGNRVQVSDPGGTVNYTYYPTGAMKIANYETHQVSVTIDGWGRKKSLNDPSAGTYSYTYNNYGELLTEVGPKGTTSYTYDPVGKVTNKTINGDQTNLTLDYVYDNVTKLPTAMNGQDHINNHAYTYAYEYDQYQRPDYVKETTGLAEFEKTITYDGFGRVDKETTTAKNLGTGDFKTIRTRNEYDTSGLLKALWDDINPVKLWQLDQLNARGQALSITLGNGYTSAMEYDAYGYLTKIEDKENDNNNPTVALHTTYSFDQQRGTLLSRENVGLNWQENFQYDHLDRLTTISGSATKTMTYDNRGRITNNTDIGTYNYVAGAKQYQLANIEPDVAGETYFEQHPTQQITYNSFKKPVDIHQQGHGRVSFEYGPLMNRAHAYYGGEDEDKLQRRYHKHYSAIIPAEIVEDTDNGSVKIITYIGGDGYTAPMAHIKTTGVGAIDEFHYLHRDYLGSIMAITDSNGTLKEERQFGAWGTVDKFINSSGGTSFDHTALLGRGYTGHEHFFEVSLIHMNGRMYDPQLGRFLSPDNYIQDPYNPQNYNRYGYAYNNPLMYVDPSGEFFLGGAEVPLLVSLVSAIFVGAAAYAIGSFVKTYLLSTPKPEQIAPNPGNTTATNTSSSAASSSRESRGNGDLNAESPSWFSQYWEGAKNGYSRFYGDIKRSVVNQYNKIVNDPWGAWTDGLKDGAKNLIPGYMPYKMIVEPHVDRISSVYNGIKAFGNGDYYGAGDIIGYQAAGDQLDAGLTLATAGGGSLVAKGFSRGVSTLAKGGSKWWIKGKRKSSLNTMREGRFAVESVDGTVSRNFSDALRAEINRIGQKHGCHTCGTKTPNGKYIPDHQPSIKLKPEGPFKLFPHCPRCSVLQGGQVNNALNHNH
ncbi:RHS repeat-associated core domain-containing protein [Spongiivirga sp. MCCC 1A20706]|uniref:RHS repeat-associated core domain-containing protein n=1 Tax=Spongiivirga sp. MCCC 1A20706 TaxID=3160963 RepID=UPI0039774BBF